MAWNRQTYFDYYNDAYLDQVVKDEAASQQLDAAEEVFYFLADTTYSPKENPQVQKDFLAKIGYQVDQIPNWTKSEEATIHRWSAEGEDFCCAVSEQFQHWFPMDRILKWVNSNQIWQFATLTNDRRELRLDIGNKYRGRCCYLTFSSLARHKTLLIMMDVLNDWPC